MSYFTNGVIDVLFSLISTIMKIVLAPIDALIMNGLPEVSFMITKLEDFLNICFSSVGWVIDAFGIPAGAISLIISYYVLKYSIHMVSIGIKIVIGWVKSFL